MKEKSFEPGRDNIVLIGMPGVGKTTIGEALAAKLGRSFVDIDSAIEEKYGSVPDYINNHGVDAFRAVESETIAEIGKQHGRSLPTKISCARTGASTGSCARWRICRPTVVRFLPAGSKRCAVFLTNANPATPISPT